MKTHLKILAATASVAILSLGSMYVLRSPSKPPHCSLLRLTGSEIESVTFVEARALIESEECVGRSAAAKRLFVIESSTGGNGAAALAIGILLHKYNWDVEVVDLCASACAIFIFPAGKTKYLNSQSMLAFHGGPHQENLMEMVGQFDRASAGNGEPVDSVVLGRQGQEGVVKYKANRSPEDEEVLEFLSLNNVSTWTERAVRWIAASDQFYRELGVNPLLGSYGQTGAYETFYKSDKYRGFIYRLDSLRRMGVDNIELRNGEWHPERHPLYPEVYEVKYP